MANFEESLPSAKLISSYLRALEDAGFAGDLGDQYGDRVTYATDNSVYQVYPQCVLYPKRTSDLNIILKVASGNAAFKEIVFSPRGGGTGANGQSLTTGVVVDVSRHLINIFPLDKVNEHIRVEPGVVLDQLNHSLSSEGYFFPPNVSTSSRATIGGMVGTDASGKGSRIYGKTSDWIHSVEVVLWDGSDFTAKEISSDQVKVLLSEKGQVGDIYRQIYKSVNDNQAEIDRVFPKMNRGLTGYNLKQLIDCSGNMKLQYLIAGSEGTLCFIKSITLKVLKKPLLSAVVVVGYSDFKLSLGHISTLLKAEPSAIEMIDDKILNLAKASHYWEGIKDVLGDVIGRSDSVSGLHFIEFVGDSEGEIQAQVDPLLTLLQKEKASGYPIVGWCLANDPHLTASVWSLRKQCQGLLAGLQTTRKAIPFVEDTAVPPAVLADYVHELHEFLESHSVDAGIFGHADVGCLHIRPMLDLKEPADVLTFRTVSDGVVALTKKYGGLMWGEHGKGYRGEYCPDTFGPVLFEELQKIKRIFDPCNKLNPGKIATPFSTPGSRLIKIDEVPFRADYDKTISDQLLAEYSNSVACNGNGACFSWDKVDVMCPSYKATRDRIHSPKGRSALLREWLRLNSDPALKNSQQFHDFTSEVYRSLETCLSCKACLVSCPVQVNIPDAKAKFLQEYYKSTSRPLADTVISYMESFIPLMSKGAGFFNWIQSLTLIKTVFRHFLGFVHLPELSAQSVDAVLRKRGVEELNEATIERLSQADIKNTVVLVQDCFTSHYDAEVFLGHYDFLEKLGFDVYVAKFTANGKALHVKGFIDKFRNVARKSSVFLEKIASYGVPLVGIEPSVTLTYRQEYQDLLIPETDLIVHYFPEWLEAQLAFMGHRINSVTAGAVNKQYSMMLHCTEKTNVPASAQLWKDIFHVLGATLDVKQSGCCGMAGFFGHESKNQEVSETLYNMSWKDIVENGSSDQLVVTGFSCRCQAKRFSNVEVQHPVFPLLKLLS